MTETAFVEQRMREVNPVSSVDDINTGELARAVAAAATARAAIILTQRQAPTNPAAPPRSRGVWAFATAFVLILASIGIAALALRSDTEPVADQLAPPTLSESPEEPLNVDSLTWSRISLGTQGPSLQVTKGGPGLVAVGVYHEPDPNDLADGGGGPDWVQGYLDVPTVWTSPDGYEWSQVPSGDDTIGVFNLGGEIAGIAGREDVLVAVRENYVWTSPDGLTWSQVPGTFRYNVDRLLGVIVGSPGLVAFGENGVSNRASIWTSPDGYAWTRVPDDPAVFAVDIHAMTAGGPGLVAVGSSHKDCEPVVLTSTDGHNWTRLPSNPAAFEESSSHCGLGGPPGHMRIRDVSTGGPGLVAVGSRMEQATVWTSRDGMAWSRVPDNPAVFAAPGTDPHTPYSEMTSVAAIGDGLVAIGRRGANAAVWASHDGIAWTDITDDLDLTGDTGLVQVIAGGPGVVILGRDLIEDYVDKPPLIEAVMWVGSPNKPTS